MGVRTYIELLKMKIQDLYESEAKLPKVLYHGTLKQNLPSIEKGGLVCDLSKSSTNGIYLTDDIFTAKSYGLMNDHGANKEHVVLVIDTKFIDQHKLRPDDYELPDYIENPWSSALNKYDFDSYTEVPWWLSLRAVNQVIYLDNIPPEAIQILNDKK